ncbi:uncharacterized protein EI90DRAFT_2937578 [Cantharellus anzutake]|uniref:uncharacterized protein n=1 Tax=Cantharellus anzutake TaxID=1750568 RepID=UPI0019039215|nr:uncharacterized protein EI90DRAFT_2937578 [Cantharellus anzutake]KAF8321960.1 hypothetical protein EI90DRAFT_2937578 [Cantharellus anzutake]
MHEDSPKIYKSHLRYEDVPVNSAYQLLFEHPTIDVPDSHTVYIDALTGVSRTRGQHIVRSKRLATALVTSPSKGGLGLTRNERVGILAENCMDYSVIVHACLYAGIPFVMLNINATMDELVHAVDLVTPSRVFITKSLLGRHIKYLKSTMTFSGVAFSSSGLGGPDQIVELKDGRDLDALLVDTISMQTLLMCNVKRNDIAYMIFSSGTTGMPKAVMISHGNVMSSMLQGRAAMQVVLKALGISSPQGVPCLATLPMYHTYGFFSTCLSNHATVNTYVILPRWEVGEALRAIEKYKIQTALLVPTMIRQLVNALLLKENDSSSLRGALGTLTSVVSASAALSPELVKEFYKILERPSNEHIATNVSVGSVSTVSIASPAFRAPKLAPPGFLTTSALTLVANTEAVLRHDSDGPGRSSEQLPRGFSVGELCIRGPNIALGYWNNKLATQETFRVTVPGVEGNDWLRTGDLFIADQDGSLWFVERIKDVMKISGSQVSPQEIEETILKHCREIVNDVCVIGVNPASRSAAAEELVPRAWVVPSLKGRAIGKEKCAQVIDSVVRERLSKIKWIVGGIEFISEVPKNSVGKTMRRPLRTQFEAQYPPKAARL